MLQADVHQGSDSFATAVIRVEMQEPTARFCKIPLKTMEPGWIVFKALVCSSMLAHFPFLDERYHIQPLLSGAEFSSPQLKLFPFEEDPARSDLEVDKSLIPFLMCFWEGCIGPNYGSLFGQDYGPD